MQAEKIHVRNNDWILRTVGYQMVTMYADESAELAILQLHLFVSLRILFVYIKRREKHHKTISACTLAHRAYCVNIPILRRDIARNARLSTRFFVGRHACVQRRARFGTQLPPQ